MTPEAEQEFIRLWQAGVETAAIARRFGIPAGTVSSRARALQQRGLIQSRPRGGAHARRVVQARQAGVPAPAQPPRSAPGGKSIRSKLWLKQEVIDALRAEAAHRGCHPAQLVEALVWQALQARQSSRPRGHE